MKYYTVWHSGYRILAVVKALDKRQATSKYIKNFRKSYSGVEGSNEDIKQDLTVELAKFIDGVLSHGEMD
jgi:hypothetical protein